MIKPLKYFHELPHNERNRVVISDLERDEMRLLYPQPEWCRHRHALDNFEGCVVLIQGFIFDDSNICRSCENFDKEKYGK